MTQYQITLSDEIVHGLFKEDGAMARLVEQVLNHVLEAEVTETLQAKPYERTEERQGYRNEFKPRNMTTRIGRLVLSVPQVREGKFSPELFARFQRSEQALILALMEIVLEEVRRRERVIRIFPNVESAKRLLGSLLMEKDEAWSTDQQYFDMRAYVEWRQEQMAMMTNELQQAAAPC